MSSYVEGRVIINCQECNITCIKIEVGKVIFTGIGMSITCAGCQAWLSRQKRGGMSH